MMMPFFRPMLPVALVRPAMGPRMMPTVPHMVANGRQGVGSLSRPYQRQLPWLKRLWQGLNTPAYGRQWLRPLPGFNNRGFSLVDIDLPGVFQHGLGGIHLNPRWNAGPLSLDFRGGDIDLRPLAGPGLILDVTPEAATAAGESTGWLGQLGEWVTGAFGG